MAMIKDRITLAIWLGWVGIVTVATGVTLTTRAVGILMLQSRVGRAMSRARSGLTATAWSRSMLIAGSTCAVFLMAALLGAAWIIGLGSGAGRLIMLGRP